MVKDLWYGGWSIKVPKKEITEFIRKNFTFDEFLEAFDNELREGKTEDELIEERLACFDDETYDVEKYMFLQWFDINKSITIDTVINATDEQLLKVLNILGEMTNEQQ